MIKNYEMPQITCQKLKKINQMNKNVNCKIYIIDMSQANLK